MRLLKKLSKIDIFHTQQELLEVFAKLPGILSLLPLTTSADNDFAKLDTWKTMQAAFGIEDWPLPREEDLAVFKTYRDTVYQRMADIDYTNMVYIAGQASATPSGYRIDETAKGTKELVFLSTAAGDQSVTWESGIPQKMIDNNAVYYTSITHGALANEDRIFPAISELLATGGTALLSKSRPAIRGEQRTFRSPIQYDFDLSPEGIERTILGLENSPRELAAEKMSLRVCVSNGDLRYASYPVLAGHFKNDAIVYAEKAIDWNLRGALTERHRLGLYPGDIGTSEVLINYQLDFAGAIIVGMGNYGTWTAFQLTQTVEQGVAKYLLDLNKLQEAVNATGTGANNLGISSLLIGCGYGGLSIESSIRAILQGVQNANNKIKALHADKAKAIEFLEFIELYEDAALSCFYTLKKIEADESKSLSIVVDRKKIKTLLGSRKRLPAIEAEGWWNRITVQLSKEAGFTGDVRCLQFNASTGGAREEQRQLYSSTAVVEQIIKDISSNNRWSPALAKTVFELLIPNDFKAQLKRQGDSNWILDKFTASYPWELLQDSAEAKPLCVNAGMIRQLATQDYRLTISPVAKNTALVIGDPSLQGFIRQLEGAKKEGELVTTLLQQQGFATTSLIQSAAPAIIQALFEEDYKIIHLAGHGLFNEQAPESSGMVIGKGVFLSTREIIQMSTVPELVVVNCCYLGQTEGVAEEYFRNRYKLAANLGTQLIENGVKAVIAAGWAVNDTAALLFTRVFYEEMFSGATFGDAVKKARQEVYDTYHYDNNTWGAYQCYGDPYYRFINNKKGEKHYAPEFVIAEEAEIELNNLSTRLETGTFSQAEYLSKLAAIANAVDKAGLRTAEITEREALLYADLYEYELAIAKFEALLQMEKANFTISTLEKYCNVRAKQYVVDFLAKKATASELLPKIKKVIADLDTLQLLSPTAERYALLGSAYKRQAMISSRKKDKMEAYSAAAYYYQQSFTIHSNLYSVYALTNWLTLESILVLLKVRQWSAKVTYAKNEYDLPSTEGALGMLVQADNDLNASADRMDYWNMVSKANIRLCRLLLASSTDTADLPWQEALAVYRSVWNKAGTRGKKQAEIEHLLFLSDAFAASEESNLKNLHTMLDQLRTDLETIL